MFLICTRIKYRQAAACSAARGCVGAHLVASGRMPAAAHTHMHTRRHAGDPRAYYMSKNERARARCSFMAVAHVPALVAAAPTASRPAVARSTAASALSHRPLAVAAAPDSPPRERPHGCRRCRRCHRCRRAARLCAYHGRCRRPSTCENRTETPTATPPGSRMAERRPRAPSGAAREAGWRRAKVGGWWRSRADAVEDGPGHFSKP